MAGKVKVIPPIEKKPVILRVAAYCRVSSDSADQLHSYAAQIKAYTELISKHPEWQLSDVYADEGLTGTRLDKREDFNRMMADCRKGRVDRILVKSISRFSRNTRDCLTSLRELKKLGVTVYFEEENIDTGTLTTELMVSVLGSLAQQESISISQNQRISYQRRMERGEFITCIAPLGYRLVDGKNLEIIPEEAELVRWIFESYLSGHSTKWIAERMTEQEISTAWKHGIWREQVIRKILTNEKYVGDSLCQKTYTTNVFPYTRQSNCGNADQYYVADTHPAIIERAAFEKVQALMQKRAERCIAPQMESPLSHKIICGICGSALKRRVCKSGYSAWVCRKHDNKATDCPMGRIAEAEIYAAFVQMYNKLKKNEGIILRPALRQLEDLNAALQRSNPAMLTINRAIAQAAEQSYNISKLQTAGLLDADVCAAKQASINAQLTQLRAERRRLLKNADIEETLDIIRQTAEIIQHGPERLEQFDEEIFAGLVEQITAISKTCLRFKLYGGLELTEHLREVGK